MKRRPTEEEQQWRHQDRPRQPLGLLLPVQRRLSSRARPAGHPKRVLKAEEEEEKADWFWILIHSVLACSIILFCTCTSMQGSICLYMYVRQCRDLSVSPVELTELDAMHTDLASLRRPSSFDALKEQECNSHPGSAMSTDGRCISAVSASPPSTAKCAVSPATLRRDRGTECCRASSLGRGSDCNAQSSAFCEQQHDHHGLRGVALHHVVNLALGNVGLSRS